jgi:hypothetical protein
MKYRLLNSPSPSILLLIGSSCLMSECSLQRTRYKLFGRTGALRCTRGKVTVVYDSDCGTLRGRAFSVLLNTKTLVEIGLPPVVGEHFMKPLFH